MKGGVFFYYAEKGEVWYIVGKNVPRVIMKNSRGKMNILFLGVVGIELTEIHNYCILQ